MGTYIMTDIHGHYDAMGKMLDKIGFSAADRLICAGDYIDRGPKTYEMLRWIEAPGENVVLVRGNHDEEFVYYVELVRTILQKEGLEKDSRADILYAYRRAKQIVSYFDYYGTIESLLREKKVTFLQLARWAACIRKMPYFYELTMHGRRCIIVHAGYVESLESLKEMETDDTYDSLEAFYLTARDDAYIYGGVEHGMILAGHTPTTARYELPFNRGKVYRVYDEETDCVFYDLDCGYAFKDVSSEAGLACLRLEDEEVFYIRE
ncbi:MAG: serine/threonine protein phosphatase [Lachnospiraceae bacterium]|jgi:predicted phosphodiesterase|nr:serine/threonine protein phosphatase [Lachnospiraceae bacterium]